VIKRGLPASIRFEAQPGLAPEEAVVEFPGHDLRLDLATEARVAAFGGQLGDFTFRTSFGTFHGYIRVVDDLQSLDLGALRELVAAYRPAGEGPAPCCGY
jgi:hypothetical protein